MTTTFLFQDNLGEVAQSALGWGLILYGEEEEKVMEASTDPVISKIWSVSKKFNMFWFISWVKIYKKRKCFTCEIILGEKWKEEIPLLAKARLSTQICEIWRSCLDLRILFI